MLSALTRILMLASASHSQPGPSLHLVWTAESKEAVIPSGPVAKGHVPTRLGSIDVNTGAWGRTIADFSRKNILVPTDVLEGRRTILEESGLVIEQSSNPFRLYESSAKGSSSVEFGSPSRPIYGHVAIDAERTSAIVVRSWMSAPDREGPQYLVLTRPIRVCTLPFSRYFDVSHSSSILGSRLPKGQSLAQAWEAGASPPWNLARGDAASGGVKWVNPRASWGCWVGQWVLSKMRGSSGWSLLSPKTGQVVRDVSSDFLGARDESQIVATSDGFIVFLRPDRSEGTIIKRFRIATL